MFGYCSIVEPYEYCFKFFHRDIFVRTTLNLCAINDSSSSCKKIQWKRKKKKRQKDLRFLDPKCLIKTKAVLW